MPTEVNEERVLVVAPIGRDGPVTCDLLSRAGFFAQLCEPTGIVHQLDQGAGLVLVAEEALLGREVKSLARWVERQSPWSDMPFLMLTSDREAPAIIAARQELLDRLRNVSLIQRPVQPITLFSAVHSALRARRRQYEVRDYLLERQAVAGRLEQLVEERTRALAGTNEQLRAEIDERLRTEEALRQSQKLEAIGHLTGGVAHDFNNLLTVISSGVDFLRQPDLPEERRERYLRAIRETVDRASALTGQLLAFARRQPLKVEAFDAAVEVPRTLEMLRSIVGSRIEVQVQIDDRPCVIRTDKSQFETALVNLAVNARDAMNGEGRLCVTLQYAEVIPQIRAHPARAGDFVSVAVSDTGTGIGPDQIGRVFEPFYTTKEVGKGTGLGLSQVYGFAKQSGGDITVESRLGSGTTFTLYLPRVDGKPTPERLEVDDTERPAPAGGRVLVVEDNREVGEFAAQLLNDLGFTTHLARDARSAFDMVESDPAGFDMVFSDIVMPGGMNGLDLARELRSRWPSLPVVLTTGYSDAIADSGNDEFEVLRKPYSIESLSSLFLRIARRDAIVPEPNAE